jgi:eukaryotic-like serine/threonine-protein kinase
MPLQPHPSHETLQALAASRLPEDEASSAQQHVEQCPACQETLGAMADATEAWAPPPARELPGGEATESFTPPSPARRRIGRYELLDKLGEGGMGAVFKARDLDLDKIVAVKLLTARLTGDAVAVQRFRREMKAVGRLEHPNLVRALDAGQENGTHYLVVEYFEGVDLAAWSRQHGPAPTHQACEIVRQATVGLDAMHRAGVVHRDIKPSNLMLTADGTVKILDLGLARLHGDSGPGAELTETGQTMGTADYIAPEQVLGARDVDIRADIYSLGCTFYKLLTGQAPFSGPGYSNVGAKLVAHVHDPIPAVTILRPDLPSAVVAVLSRMTAKSPQDRYPTPADLLAALDRPLAEPHQPQPTKSKEKRGHPFWQQIRWTRSRMAIALGGLLLILLGVWVIVRDKDRRELARVHVPEGGSVETAKEDNEKRLPAFSEPPKPELAASVPIAQPLPPRNLTPDSSPPDIAPFDAVQARAYQHAWAEHLGVQVEIENSIGMKFVLIPPGEFVMGSTVAAQQIGRRFLEGRLEQYEAEQPPHRVRLTRAFFLGTHEVTVADFRRFVTATGHQTRAEKEGKAWGYKKDLTWSHVPGRNWRNPGFDQQDTHPVTCVTWDDAMAFCQWLSREDRRAYGLPTEAEWEYACRAGTHTVFFWGDDPDSSEGYLNGADETGTPDERSWPYKFHFMDGYAATSPVGRFKPNAFGLYDMLGNVWEWCADWYGSGYYHDSPMEDPTGPAAGSNRVGRGGGWSYGAWFCRSACRGRALPGSPDNHLGFRVACSL